MNASEWGAPLPGPGGIGGGTGSLPGPGGIGGSGGGRVSGAPPGRAHFAPVAAPETEHERAGREAFEAAERRRRDRLERSAGAA